MARTYAIGDAHGRFDLVQRALELAEADCGDQPGTFVCCGDFVDRGPQSRDIIELFMRGPDKPNWSWVILAGNHEDMIPATVDGLNHFNWWVGNGGGDTLRSYGAQSGMTINEVMDMIPQAHIEWLRLLPVHHLDRHRAFVHAGFDPGRMLEEQSREYMTWTRDSKSSDYSFLGRHVVHGHEPYQDGPILNRNKSNIDTYAWRHGRLAVAVFDDDIAGGPIDILWAEGAPSEHQLIIMDDVA